MGKRERKSSRDSLILPAGWMKVGFSDGAMIPIKLACNSEACSVRSGPLAAPINGIYLANRAREGGDIKQAVDLPPPPPPPLKKGEVERCETGSGIEKCSRHKKERSGKNPAWRICLAVDPIDLIRADVGFR